METISFSSSRGDGGGRSVSGRRSSVMRAFIVAMAAALSLAACDDGEEDVPRYVDASCERVETPNSSPVNGLEPDSGQPNVGVGSCGDAGPPP
jgi:hypothetical protein